MTVTALIAIAIVMFYLTMWVVTARKIITHTLEKKAAEASQRRIKRNIVSDEPLTDDDDHTDAMLNGFFGGLIWPLTLFVALMGHNLKIPAEQRERERVEAERIRRWAKENGLDAGGDL